MLKDKFALGATRLNRTLSFQCSTLATGGGKGPRIRLPPTRSLRERIPRDPGGLSTPLNRDISQYFLFLYLNFPIFLLMLAPAFL